MLDFKQKLEIIIAQIYGMGTTTVNDMKHNAGKIEEHESKMQSFDGDVKTRKTCKP